MYNEVQAHRQAVAENIDKRLMLILKRGLY